MNVMRAVVAGEGLLPQEIARRLTARGNPPVVYALREEVGELSKFALELLHFPRLELKAVMEDLLQRGVQELILAGGVPKTLMYHPALLDDSARQLVRSIRDRDDHSLLGGVVAYIENAGIRVVQYADIIEDLLAPEGHIAGREPTEREWDDLCYGCNVASQVLHLSFGQTVVICDRSVVAVEAMEGTDAALLRAGGLCKGGVVVKMMRADQDMRYDLPTVGTKTLVTMARAGLRCLAVEAGRTVILTPEYVRGIAADMGIAVVGVRHCPSS